MQIKTCNLWILFNEVKEFLIDQHNKKYSWVQCIKA
jgi:hypothetical protein